MDEELEEGQHAGDSAAAGVGLGQDGAFPIMQDIKRLLASNLELVKSTLALNEGRAECCSTEALIGSLRKDNESMRQYVIDMNTKEWTRNKQFNSLTKRLRFYFDKTHELRESLVCAKAELVRVEETLAKMGIVKVTTLQDAVERIARFYVHAHPIGTDIYRPAGNARGAPEARPGPAGAQVTDADSRGSGKRPAPKALEPPEPVPRPKRTRAAAAAPGPKSPQAAAERAVAQQVPQPQPQQAPQQHGNPYPFEYRRRDPAADSDNDDDSRR